MTDRLLVRSFAGLFLLVVVAAICSGRIRCYFALLWKILGTPEQKTLTDWPTDRRVWEKICYWPKIVFKLNCLLHQRDRERAREEKRLINKCYTKSRYCIIVNCFYRVRPVIYYIYILNSRIIIFCFWFDTERKKDDGIERKQYSLGVFA